MTEITLPKIDENVVEYTIGVWLKNVGEWVDANDAIVEVETDKVTMEVVAESAGTMTEILAQPGDVLRPGDLLAKLKPAEGDLPVVSTPVQHASATVPQVLKTVAETPKKELRLSPVVGRMIAEHHLDVDQLVGSGKNGRITKKDVLAFLKEADHNPQPRIQPAVVKGQNGSSQAPVEKPDMQPGNQIPLTKMRRSIGEHMVRSLATSPHVTTIFEFDFHRVKADRAKHKDQFAADGVKLTYMAYLALATVQALQKFPVVNSRFHDDRIELIKEINLGIIVAVPDGLYAPVIQHADEYNLKGLARAIGDLSEKAHSGQLAASDMQGGTFTISNHGSAGSIAGTPIIFQPQAGILGVGMIEDRVKVIDGGMHIRPCSYISFSFDHRIMDGATSDQFCGEIKRLIENWPED